MTSVHDQFHPAVWEDPESVWDRIRDYLGRASSKDGMAPEEWLTSTDLIEDLMFHHSEAFIDRVEALAEGCWVDVSADRRARAPA